MGLMAIGFAACTQNEDMTPTLKGQEINATFSVGGMQTRVNTLGHGDNWENDDLISVLQIYGDESTRTGKYKYIEEMDKHVGIQSTQFVGKERKDAN